MQMLIAHKPHNANHVNTGRATTGEVRDRFCKMEIHLSPPTQLILRSLLADLQLVRHSVELLAMPAG